MFGPYEQKGMFADVLAELRTWPGAGAILPTIGSCWPISMVAPVSQCRRDERWAIATGSTAKRMVFEEEVSAKRSRPSCCISPNKQALNTETVPEKPRTRFRSDQSMRFVADWLGWPFCG